MYLKKFKKKILCWNSTAENRFFEHHAKFDLISHKDLLFRCRGNILTHFHYGEHSLYEKAACRLPTGDTFTDTFEETEPNFKFVGNMEVLGHLSFKNLYSP
jgi:hypothetical protein